MPPNEFNTDGLGIGADKKLKSKELLFWNELIAEYLKPLEQTKTEKANGEKSLKELRNTYAFTFMMINCIWIVIVIMIQEKADILGYTWPLAIKVTSPISAQYYNNVASKVLQYCYN